MMQVFAVFLVVATICIFAVGKWSESQIKEKNDRLFGRWNEVFLNVDEEDVEYFRQHAFVDDYSVQNIQEKIYLEGDDRIIIGTCDDNFFELGNLEMVDGRMPVNEGEVAIEEEYLEVLGVEKVGDIISEGVNIDSLKGYRVCGIVKDYSSRWKMVNWDVKYINCFISDANANEIQIYASLSSAVQQDIETNMLEYRKNVEIDENRSIPILFNFVIISISFIAVIRMNLQKKLNNREQIHMVVGNNYDKKDMKLNKKNQLFVIIMTNLLKVLLYALVVLFYNKIIFQANYLEDVNFNMISNYQQMNSLHYYSGSIKSLWPLDIVDNIEFVKIIPNKWLESMVELVNLLLMVILLFYIILKLAETYIEQGMGENIEQKLFVYYGKGRLSVKKHLLKYLKEILIYFIIVFLIISCFSSSINISEDIVIINLILVYFTLWLIVSVQHFILYRIKHKLEHSDDWLLTTEVG